MNPGQDIVASRTPQMEAVVREWAILMDDPQPGNRAWYMAVRRCFRALCNIMSGASDTPPAASYLWECRACGYPVAPEDHVATGATQVGEGCYAFHRQCLDGLSPEARAECNRVSSTYFEEFP